MRDRSRLVFQPLLVLGCFLLISACAKKPLPLHLEKFCVSDSGLSKYWVTLRISERTGEIRYKYMGQDVRYNVANMEIDGDTISGQADFLFSSTGETRGTPIGFSYDNATDVLKDGGTSAACQNIQGGE